MINPLEEDRGQDLFKTSTHTAHHYRPNSFFPSSHFQVILLRFYDYTYFLILLNSKPVIYDPIPNSLNLKDQVLPDTHFQTTTKVFHDNKFTNQDLYNDPLSMRQIKPLPSYKVNYIYDVLEKVNFLIIFSFYFILKLIFYILAE
jgi:hypothetical protein